MRLKELQLFGFKSFADRTVLEFGKGITIVVGPNGSGKSNIVDAIRWVMGEQSAKSLRGGKMEDIIFAGSDTRKTLGLSEVSLILDNEDKSFDLPYNEIKITRKLYRSGDSEYMINDNPVRLKDINEMFMDTGLGLDTYSIISQGEVDKIINAKPSQRREIFEEAAGITKYITRRDEAIRKLESTEESMLRINDILSEVKRQMSSLERQAKRAEKYKVLKSEYDEMAIKHFMKDIKEKTAEFNKLQGENEDLNRKIEAENAGLQKTEFNYAGMRIKEVEIERDVTAKREAWLIKEQEIKRLEDNLNYLSVRIVDASNRIAQLKTENVENVGKLESLKLDIAGKNKIKDAKGELIKGEEEKFKTLSLEVTDVGTAFETSKKGMDDKRILLEMAQEEAAGFKTNLVQEETNIKNLEGKLEELLKEKKEVEAKLNNAASELGKIKQSKEIKEEGIKGLKEREEGLLKEKLKMKTALEVLDSIIKELDLSISKMDSRHNFLKELHEKFEGYGEIVKKVLTDYKNGLAEDDKKNIIDVAGNIITVDKRYETAVEKTLADILQTVIVRNDSIIKDIFKTYETSKGEISFLNTGYDLDFDGILLKWSAYLQHSNILAYLPNTISVNAENKALKLLFHNIYMVADIEKAMEVFAFEKKEEQYFLLTLNGELLSNFATYRKGEGDNGAGFLSREREMSEIINEVLMARQKFLSIVEERGIQAGRLAEVEREIEMLSQDYHEQYVEIVKDSERAKQREEEEALLHAGIKKTHEALIATDAEKTIIVEKKAGFEAKIMASEKMVEEFRGAISQLNEEILNRETELTGKRLVTEDKRIEVLTMKNDFEIELNNLINMNLRLEELKLVYDNTGKEIEENTLRITTIEAEKLEGTLKIENLKSTLSSDETGWTTRKAELDAFRVDLKKIEEEIKKLSEENDTFKERQYTVKLKINELSLESKNIFDKLVQDFNFTPDDQKINDFNIPAEEYTELSVKMSEYKEKMDSMGMINLVAIEEYNENKKRGDFLQAQYDDLVSARENLKKVIKKTNEESQQLFETAFAQIRTKFGEVFNKMMNGGEADLLLLDKENMLESGIEIIARPPGKKLQNISLLSGGEKCITATSLLFAIFLIKASPFFLMDEIDAPLDDINVVRFTNLVKSFVSLTQFIIISHNKVTMEIADTIYGVSMQKDGVSRILSVKMDNDKAIDKTRANEPFDTSLDKDTVIEKITLPAEIENDLPPKEDSPEITGEGSTTDIPKKEPGSDSNGG
ncbi:MAG: chromosome segregation protein SMC [bacterium]